MALIRFFYNKHEEDLDIETFAKLESELMWLLEIGALPIKKDNAK